LRMRTRWWIRFKAFGRAVCRPTGVAATPASEASTATPLMTRDPGMVRARAAGGQRTADAKSHGTGGLPPPDDEELGRARASNRRGASKNRRALRDLGVRASGRRQGSRRRAVTMQRPRTAAPNSLDFVANGQTPVTTDWVRLLGSYTRAERLVANSSCTEVDGHRRVDLERRDNTMTGSTPGGPADEAGLVATSRTVGPGGGRPRISSEGARRHHREAHTVDRTACDHRGRHLRGTGKPCSDGSRKGKKHTFSRWGKTGVR